MNLDPSIPRNQIPHTWQGSGTDPVKLFMSGYFPKVFRWGGLLEIHCSRKWRIWEECCRNRGAFWDNVLSSAGFSEDVSGRLLAALNWEGPLPGGQAATPEDGAREWMVWEYWAYSVWRLTLLEQEALHHSSHGDMSPKLLLLKLLFSLGTISLMSPWLVTSPECCPLVAGVPLLEVKTKTKKNKKIPLPQNQKTQEQDEGCKFCEISQCN